MRIACFSTPEGNVYRFYKTEASSYQALKAVIPFLLASRAEMIIGDEENPEQPLRVGPVSGEAEASLLRIVEANLSEPCAFTLN